MYLLSTEALTWGGKTQETRQRPVWEGKKKGLKRSPNFFWEIKKLDAEKILLLANLLVEFLFPKKCIWSLGVGHSNHDCVGFGWVETCKQNGEFWMGESFTRNQQVQPNGNISGTLSVQQKRSIYIQHPKNPAVS